MKRFFSIAIPVSIPMLLASLVAAQQLNSKPSHAKASTPAPAAVLPSGVASVNRQWLTHPKSGKTQQDILGSILIEVQKLSPQDRERNQQALKSLYVTHDRNLNFTEEDAEKVRVIHPLLTPQIMAQVKVSYPLMTPETMARVKLRYASPKPAPEPPVKPAR